MDLIPSDDNPYRPSAAELALRLAIRIESEGIEFYGSLAERLSRPEMKTIFGIIRSDEIAHKETFEVLLADAKSVRASPNLAAYVGEVERQRTGIIFDISAWMALKNADPVDLIAPSINAENNSIEYYRMIKKAFPADISHVIEKIIIEERRHVRKFNEIRDVLMAKRLIPPG